MLPNSLLAIANPLTPYYIDELHQEFAPQAHEKECIRFASQEDAVQAFQMLRPHAMIVDIDSVRPSQALVIRDNLRGIAPLLPFILTARRIFPKFSFSNRITPLASSVYWINTALPTQETFLESVGRTIGGNVDFPREITQDLRRVEDSFGGLSPLQKTIVQLLAQGLSNKAISAECNLSVKAIERHISMIAKIMHIEPHTNDKSLRMLVVLEYMRLSRNDTKHALLAQ